MKLSELIAEIGDKNVECEFLSSILHGKQKQLNGMTQITLSTPHVQLIDLVSEKSPKIGMLIWLPRDKFEAIRDR